MRKIGWIALVLEISPLFAFICLAILHPTGDPQKSSSFLVQMLDFQATYWIRKAIPMPPPLLLAGFLASLFLWWRHRFVCAQIGSILGIAFLGIWGFVMLVPLLVHVN